MIIQSDVRFNSLFRSFARGGSVAVVLFGCLVLLGWIFDITAFKTFLVSGFAVKANAAVAFLLAGASLRLALGDLTDRRIHLLKQACAVAVALIGLLTLSQNLSGWNLGIDQLLFKEPVGAFGTSSPGRMGPNTALDFLLIGLGLLFLDRKTLHRLLPSDILIIPACVIATLAVLGHLYGVEELFGIRNYTLMPLQTGVAFIILCLSIFLMRPNAGLMLIITNNGGGGLLVRRLLPVAFIVPVVVGWIGLLGQRAGLFDTEFGTSLMVVTTMVVLIILILVTARALVQADVARKKAEEALLKAGALQSAIFNSANFSSIATDAKGVIQIFNVGAERMLGYTAAEVMNKITPADISDPQEVIIRAEALSAELGTPIKPGFEALVFKASRGIEDIYELTYFRKDGSRFPAVVSVTALRDKQDSIIGYLLIGTDNTARKEIESDRQLLAQRLRDHQFYTRSLFESNIDAIMTTDPDGIITDVNKQMEVLTGCTRDELIGAPFKSYFTDPERAEASIKLVLSQKKVIDYELTVRARDGKETVVSYNATTFYDRDRKLQGMFAAARDVTERNILDKVLKEKNVELEAVNKEMEDFSYSVSHDLRAPLRAIDGFSRKVLVGYGERLDDEGRRQLQVVRDNAQRMGELIDNLLAFSRMGRREIILQPLDMDAMVNGVVDELRAAEPDRSIEFALSPLPRARGDVAMMRQVWVNLLSNAVKFTRQRQTAHIEVGCREETGELHYWVKDDGAGFDMQYAEKLFGVFQRLHRQDEFEGTGVGLAIVQRILHRHKGSIWGEGKTDEGATLHFLLPLPVKE